MYSIHFKCAPLFRVTDPWNEIPAYSCPQDFKCGKSKSKLLIIHRIKVDNTYQKKNLLIIQCMFFIESKNDRIGRIDKTQSSINITKTGKNTNIKNLFNINVTISGTCTERNL